MAPHEQIALNASNQQLDLFNVTSPDPGLVLKMSGPSELLKLQLDEKVEEDVWSDIRKSFAIPDLESRHVRVREQALLKNTRMVNALLERSEPYIYFIAQECAKRGMPAELALLPFVESEFNPHARSSAAAVGLWQFVPSTGRQYSLRQNKWVDERRDLVASTRAALDYLGYLYNMHGDWHLALISYNWGEGSVLKAMKKAQNAGLAPTWANLDLPQETRQYIPKLQALKNLIKDPQRFGMTLPEFPNKPYFEEIKRNADVDLREVARLAGVELGVIRELNPGLNQPVLYAAYSNSLLVPIKYSAKIQEGLAHYKASKPLRQYTVRKGDTLGEIAEQFDVSSKDLASINGLGEKKIIKPGMKLTIPNTLQAEKNWNS
ncbi:MAG: transglycosylase SLT domain-containing protein [Limnobacter sp.]|uniref:transglycosylase SLT domain-containing protein n=1 Tax=Limnobacter sp. TaxID=2003368 RepID=UPI0022C47C4D|nr:transglycosylase SLT domain-containing protein [Limnobacter sp.]MCZ8015798.1 transglycosylase SLT domain-containing protein [Limnobacter sp.]